MYLYPATTVMFLRDAFSWMYLYPATTVMFLRDPFVCPFAELLTYEVILHMQLRDSAIHL